LSGDIRSGEGDIVTAQATMQIEVDIDRCMGAGQCVFAAPQHFDDWVQR